MIISAKSINKAVKFINDLCELEATDEIKSDMVFKYCLSSENNNAYNYVISNWRRYLR